MHQPIAIAAEGVCYAAEVLTGLTKGTTEATRKLRQHLAFMLLSSGCLQKAY